MEEPKIGAAVAGATLNENGGADLGCSGTVGSSFF